MSNIAMTGGAAGAIIATINAIKASGAIVRVEPDVFLEILQKTEHKLVIFSGARFLTPNKYMTSYRGFVFFTKSKAELLIPASVEVVLAKKIWVPEL